MQQVDATGRFIASNNRAAHKMATASGDVASAMARRIQLPTLCKHDSLDIAQLNSLAQRSHRIPRRNELLRQVPREPLLHNRPADHRVLQLLPAIDLVPPGHAAGVVMVDVLE